MGDAGGGVPPAKKNKSVGGAGGFPPAKKINQWECRRSSELDANILAIPFTKEQINSSNSILQCEYLVLCQIFLDQNITNWIFLDLQKRNFGNILRHYY